MTRRAVCRTAICPIFLVLPVALTLCTRGGWASDAAPANSQAVPTSADSSAEPAKTREAGGTRTAKEHWFDYEHIFADILKNKESVATPAPMPVQVNDLEFGKVYETPVEPKWNSWAQTYVTDRGAVHLVFKVIEGGSSQLPAPCQWQFIGPKALGEASTSFTLSRLGDRGHPIRVFFRRILGGGGPGTGENVRCKGL